MIDPGIAALVLAAVILVTAIFLGAKMSALSDAIDKNTAAVTALTAAVAGASIATPAEIAQLGTNTTGIDAATTTLGGTPPPA